MSRVGSALIVMVIVIAVVLVMRAHTGAEKPPEQVAEAFSKHFATAPKGSLTPEAVLAIAPHAASNAPSGTGYRLAPSLRDFYASRNYAPIYARLSKGPRTPEEHWVLARILEHCAMVPDEAPRGAAHPVKEVIDAQRAQFAASLSPSDPDRDKRLAAYDNSMRNPCQDLPRLQSTRAEIHDLYAQGAAAGDPKARVALVLEDLRAQRRERSTPNGTPNFPKLGDDQVAVIKQALASADPTTAMEAASTLFSAFGNVSVRDPDGKSVDVGALRNAATLIACDSGYPCGPDTAEIARSCAYVGRCGADNLRDFLLYYRSSPYDSQVLARYEAALREAARTGNTAFFVFYPAPAPGFAMFQ